MPEAPRPGRLEQLGLVLVTGGASACALLWGWALLPVGLLSLAWRIRRASPAVLRWATMGVRAVLAVVALTAASLSFYPVLDDVRIARLGDVYALVLLPIAVLALFSTPVVPPLAGALPLGLALLAVALFDPGADLGLRAIVPTAGALLFLVTSAPRRGARHLIRVAVLAGAAGALAFGIARLLPWLQPVVEQASADFLNPAAARGGLSETSHLGGIAEMSLSRAAALRVWGDPPRKLRGRVLTEFDGRTWRAGRATYRDTGTVDPALLPDAVDDWLSRVPGKTFGTTELLDHPTTGRMLIAPVGLGTGSVLVAPAPLRAVRADVSRLRRDRADAFEPFYELPAAYAVLFAPAGTAISPDAGASAIPALLAVPPDTDPRIRELAARLARGAAGPEERLARTLEHLWSGYRYSLAAGSFHSNQPVAEFLFEKKTGWCEYFASAAVLLLRLQDVPARYVTGFSMDGATHVGDHWLVRESDAHAWVEVALPGRGWIEVDPTPAGDYAAVHAAMNGGLSRYLDAVRAAFADLRMAIRLGDLVRVAPAIARLVLSPVVLVPVAGAVLFLWRRRGRSRAQAPPPAPVGEVDPQVSALMARVDALWAACGQPRPHHRAPREHLDATVHRLPTETRDPSRAVVECVYRARYAGERAAAAELDRLRRSLDTIGA